MSKIVTIAELIEASEKNGFPWSHDDEDHYVRGVISCVVGQGILNLDGKLFPRPENEPIYSYEFYETDLGSALRDIYHYNDIKARTYKGALAYMKKKLKPFLNERVII